MISRKKLTRLLFEDTPPLPDPDNKTLKSVDQKETYQPSNISLDEKVDRLIMQYERESSPSKADKFMTNSKPIPNISDSRILRKKSFQSLIFEADDLDLGGSGDMGGGMDSSGGPDLGGGGLGDIGGGDSDKSFEPPVPVPSPKLNLNNFAGRVATLIQNYDSLIDPRSVMLNRIQLYIKQNYSEKMSNELMIKLQRDYGLTANMKQPEMQGPTSIGAGVGDLSANPSSGGSLTGGSE